MRHFQSGHILLHAGYRRGVEVFNFGTLTWGQRCRKLLKLIDSLTRPSNLYNIFSVFVHYMLSIEPVLVFVIIHPRRTK
jgi:hypothetical protein